MTRRHFSQSAAITCLLAAAVSQAAATNTSTAQVVISGSTLFEPFFQTPASGNDFVDVDGNGFAGYNPSGSISDPANPYVQNIAPVISSGNIAANGTITYPNNFSSGVLNTPALSVAYRGTGSVGGLMEFLSAQSGSLQFQPLSSGRVNGFQVSNQGVPTGGWTTNAGGFPTGVPINTVDAAVLDVSATWGTQGAAGVTAWNRKPTQSGYGTNPLASSTGYTNQLASLTVNGTTFNLNTASPNSRTLYNTSVASVPINFVANPGAGITQVKTSQLQQLYVTGRMPNGENLVAATRGIVSGTRNGAMNSIGVDPSFGVGENIGTDATGANFGKLGATYQPGNADGSGDMENIISNSRLAVGYDGSDRAYSKSAGKWGSLQVMFDTQGGTQYVTPTVSTMLNNSDPNTGWRIFGTETFVTAGDPNATAVGTFAGNGNPAMSNAAAAKYIRNITESVANYVTAPTSNTNDFMPAQVIVSNFIPSAAPQYIQSATDGSVFIANPAFSQTVHDDAANKGNYNAPLVSAQGNGFVPQRIPYVGAYSDGSTNGAYINPDTGTATITSAMALNDRNRLAGDFNGSGVRDLHQIPQMMAAVASPRTWSQSNFGTGSVGGTGMSKDYAIPEIIGDFNGDGNFNQQDVRYFADGLALDPSTGMVNRKAGFTAVDNNWTASTPGHPAGNYFNTTITTGKVYQAGDSRGDIAGSAQGPTPGAGPTGSDGVIDAKDIDYVKSQIKAATGQTSIQATNPSAPDADVNGNFSTLLTRATANPLINVQADFSADINGDGKINSDDLTALIQNVLGTNYGDANLDGRVDLTDLDIVLNNLGTTQSAWAAGNFDGAATIDFSDLNNVLKHMGLSAPVGSNAVAYAESVVAGTTAVPEPGALVLLVLGAPALLIRRKTA